MLGLIRLIVVAVLGLALTSRPSNVAQIVSTASVIFVASTLISGLSPAADGHRAGGREGWTRCGRSVSMHLLDGRTRSSNSGVGLVRRFLQLGGDQVEPPRGPQQGGIPAGAGVPEDLVAGQHEPSDEIHELVEQADVDADIAIRDR